MSTANVAGLGNDSQCLHVPKQLPEHLDPQRLAGGCRENVARCMQGCLPWLSLLYISYISASHMKAITLVLSPISTSSKRNRSLRLRRASSTVLYCVLQVHTARAQS